MLNGTRGRTAENAKQPTGSFGSILQHPTKSSIFGSEATNPQRAP
jgi:hypothetical protein